MNFNLAELEALFCDLEDIIDYVETSNFSDRRFSLFLSNGDKVNYQLFKDHIPHLLGIDIASLIATGMFNQKSSFNVLKEMVDNPYRIYKAHVEGIIDFKNIFSEYIHDKVKVFKTNISPNIYEMEFVCKYKSSRSYNVTDKNAKYDYILVKKIRDTDNYAVLCLVNNGGYYTAMSSMYFDTKEEMQEYLKDYVENQEITLFNGIRTQGNYGGYDRSYNLKPEAMVVKLKQIRNYERSFNAITNTTDQLIFSIDKALESFDKRSDDSILISDLINNINSGRTINRDKYIGSSLVDVVDSFNNLLCSGIQSVEAAESYSDMQKALKTLKDEYAKITTELETIKSERDKYIELNKNLEEENVIYKNNEESIRKILMPGN